MAAKTKSTKKDEKPLPRRYRVENFVIPTAGPHKGHRHKVIHVHPDGSVNIQPWDLDPARVKYKMGVAYARLDQLEPAWLKEDTDEDDELTNQITEQVAEKAPAA